MANAIAKCQSMKVERIEVKRCFVASEKGKRLRGKGTEAFKLGFKEIEREVLGMSESSISNQISPDWPCRLHDYDRLTWYFEECSVDDLGVWPEAGGLPQVWCIESLRNTALCIMRNPKETIRLKVIGRDKRAVENIPGIVEVAAMISKIPLLAPIVVPPGLRRPSPPYRLMKGNIDDGSMRAIAFALKGIERFKVYLGKDE
jgi:hypothetical protein